MAVAIETPSKVEVPLPTSSSIIKLFSVALFIMLETSLISTINVLCPESMSSEAPILVRYLSTTESFASFAGTYEPA